MLIRGVLQTDIEIAGGQYPCDFKVIDGLDYKGALGRDFCYAQKAQISFETLTIALKNPPTVLFSDALVAVVAPSTYIIPPRSEVVFLAIIPEKTTPGVVGLVKSPSQIAESYQLQGAAALVRIADDHTVPFRLFNPTSQPVTLRKGVT